MDHLRLLLSWGGAEEEEQEQEDEVEDETTIFDADIDDGHNPFAASEYTEEIHEYLKDRELAYLVDPALFSRQPHTTPRMRLILVSWMFEVFLSYRLEHDTFFLGVHILDRYLAARVVDKTNLQLVGCVCIFIAAKYEEVYAITTSGIVHIMDKACTKKDVVRMEQSILGVLGYDLSSPNVNQFHRRVAKVAGIYPRVFWMSRYILCLSQLHFSAVSMIRPSLLAAATVYLASTILLPEQDAWSATLEYYTGYTESDLQECVGVLNEVLKLADDNAKFYTVVPQAFAKHSDANISFVPTSPELKAHLKAIAP